jgi:hypothetical protein
MGKEKENMTEMSIGGAVSSKSDRCKSGSIDPGIFG